MGDLLSVVRIKRDMRPPLNETDLMARLNTVDEQSTLSALMEHAFDRFINSHILRITLPPGITAALKGKARSASGNTLDINLSRAVVGEGISGLLVLRDCRASVTWKTTMLDARNCSRYYNTSSRLSDVPAPFPNRVPGRRQWPDGRNASRYAAQHNIRYAIIFSLPARRSGQV